MKPSCQYDQQFLRTASSGDPSSRRTCAVVISTLSLGKETDWRCSLRACWACCRSKSLHASRMRRGDIPIVVAASLVFADATIVTLALPNVLVDLHTTVYGVAAVLAVYTAALGANALLAPRLTWAGSARGIVGALIVFSL